MTRLTYWHKLSGHHRTWSAHSTLASAALPRITNTRLSNRLFEVPTTQKSRRASEVARRTFTRARKCGATNSTCSSRTIHTRMSTLTVLLRFERTSSQGPSERKTATYERVSRSSENPSQNHDRRVFRRNDASLRRVRVTRRKVSLSQIAANPSNHRPNTHLSLISATWPSW